MSKSKHPTAATLAAALRKAGIRSGEHKMHSDPFLAAKQAYLIHFCGGKNLNDWIEDIEIPILGGDKDPKTAARQLAGLCRSALKDRDTPAKWVEAITFAWGYYVAKEESVGIGPNAKA